MFTGTSENIQFAEAGVNSFMRIVVNLCFHEILGALCRCC
jgi:hypothetical protein